MNYFKSLLLFITFLAGMSLQKTHGMEFLPAMSRNIEHMQQEINAAKTCAVCKEDFTSIDETVRLSCNPGIPHIFHKSCLKPWIDAHNTCPTCRTIIQTPAYIPALNAAARTIINSLNSQNFQIFLMNLGIAALELMLFRFVSNKMTGHSVIKFNLKNLLAITTAICMYYISDKNHNLSNKQKNVLAIFGMILNVSFPAYDIYKFVKK